MDLNNTNTNIPLYKSHVVVRAFKIGKIEGLKIYAKDSEEFLIVNKEFSVKNNLNQPGYVVLFDDGTVTFALPEFFEKAFTLS